MRRRLILRWIVLTALSLTVIFVLSTIVHDKSAAATVDKPGDVTEGSLQYLDKDGKPAECPLKHTVVKAAVCGFPRLREHARKQDRSSLQVSTAASRRC